MSTLYWSRATDAENANTHSHTHTYTRAISSHVWPVWHVGDVPRQLGRPALSTAHLAVRWQPIELYRVRDVPYGVLPAGASRWWWQDGSAAPAPAKLEGLGLAYWYLKRGRVILMALVLVQSDAECPPFFTFGGKVCHWRPTPACSLCWLGHSCWLHSWRFSLKIHRPPPFHRVTLFLLVCEAALIRMLGGDGCSV